ncbi:MAG: TetR/AcrR family transcriptional regulator [Betaproteobacteria bacterium]
MTPDAPGRKLSSQTIVLAAITRIEMEGVEALSMRSLARHLGVEAMSLYHYFKSKDELLDAVAEELVIRARPRVETPWDEALRDCFAQHVAMARQFPRTAPLIYSRLLRDGQSLSLMEWVLERLAEAGVPSDQRLHWFRLYGTVVDGFGLLISRRALQGHLIKPQTLKPYPHLQLAMSAAKTGKGRIDESLSLGIEWLIHGINLAAKQAHQVRKRGTDASKDRV